MPLSDRYMKYLQLLNVFQLRQECRYYGRGTMKLHKNYLIELIKEVDVKVVSQREQEIFGEVLKRANWATQKFDLTKIEKKGQFPVNYGFIRKHDFEILEEGQKVKADEQVLNNSECQKIFCLEPIKISAIAQLQNQMIAMSKRAIKFQSRKIVKRYQISSFYNKQDQTQKDDFLHAANSKTPPSADKINQFEPDQKKISLQVLSLTLSLLKTKVLKNHSWLLSLPRDSASPEQIANDIEILKQIENMSNSEKEINAFGDVFTLLKNKKKGKKANVLNKIQKFMALQPAFCQSVLALEKVATIARLLQYLSMHFFFSKQFNVRLSLVAANLLCLLRTHTVIWKPNTWKEEEVVKVHEQYLKILMYIERNLDRVDSSNQVALILQLISASIQIKKNLTELVRSPGQLVGGDTNESYFSERFRMAVNDENLKVNGNSQWELADILDLSPNQNLVEEIVQIVLQQRSKDTNYLEVNNFDSVCSFALNIFFLRNYAQIPQMCIEDIVIRLQLATNNSLRLFSQKICSELIKQLYTLNRIQGITESFVVKICQDWFYHQSILSEKESSEEAMVEVIKLLWVIFEYQVDSIIFSRSDASIMDKLAVEVRELLKKQENEKWLSSGTVSRLVIDKFKQAHKDFLRVQ